jgi:hypothetical protein
VADSLTLAGIELLDQVPSTVAGLEGAVFLLDPAFDLSAPTITSSTSAGLLLDGEQIYNFRASNRTPKIPVSIVVYPTGDSQADRLTLEAAREYLLRSASQDRWQLIWTRDGGLPLVYDCMGLSSTVINSALEDALGLVSQVELDFQAFPYGRSDDEETILFAAPSQTFDQPVTPVMIDAFGTAANFLTGNDTGFETSAGHWVSGGNASVARTTAQAHSGVASLGITASSAGFMAAASADPTLITTLGMPCNPGDTVTATGWFRAATTGRSCNMGVDFYDGNGVFISTLRGSNVSDLTTTFTQATSGGLTAPNGAAFCRANGQVASVGAGGELHYLDDVTLNRGPVMSQNDPGNWTPSSLTAITSQASAFWSRSLGDAPLYDRILPAPLDITGRTKLGFWLGLATTVSAAKNWHKGPVTVRMTLTDPQGDVISFGSKQIVVQASSLQNKPKWQHISAAIPQNVPNFDYTNVVRYSIQIWNTWNTLKSQPVLQSSAYFNNVVASATSTGSPGTRGGWYTMPGIVGTARAPIAFQATPGPSSFSTVTAFTAVGSNNFTGPVGVTKLDKVESWAGGGGGAGGDNVGQNPGGGGGAGEYSMDINVPVTAGNTYHPVVGAAGQGGTANLSNQTAGGDSWFIGDSGKTTYSHGGSYGFRTQIKGGGKGGSGSTSYVHHSGGDGFAANFYTPGTRRGGGGGSSGGTNADGNDANSGDGAPAPSGGGPGGQGGHTVAADGPVTGSVPTTIPGGGGGGGCYNGQGSHNGANGASGEVRLTYGASGILPMNSLLIHIPSPDAPAELSPLCPVGNGADVPNGATEYTVPPVGTLAARFDGSYSLWLVNGTWNSPASPRDLTVVVKQYAYSSGPSISQTMQRLAVTPSTDIVNGYVDMGTITLPLWDLPPGNYDGFIVVTVTSSNTSDRFLDVLFLDTQGQLVFINMPGTAFANNIWGDQAELDRDQGRISASDLDRDRARSVIGSDPSNRVSGGPLSVTPDRHNRVLVYQGIGVPSVIFSYLPCWWAGRLQ